MKYFLILISLLFCHAANAQDQFEYSSFAKLPVQYEGRIQPIDSFSKNMLTLISGSESIDGIDANHWLAEVLLDPARALERPIFRIFKPHVVDLAEDKRYFSYAELSPALMGKAESIQQLEQTEPAKWSADQAELMRIQEAGLLYAQLLRSFSLVLPLNMDVPQSLQKEFGLRPPFTLQDYSRYAKSVEQNIAKVVRKKGDEPERYTKEEREVSIFAFHMQMLSMGGDNNVLFRIVPGAWGSDAIETWHSPWELVQIGQSSQQAQNYLKLWQDMARAFVSNDTAHWDAATKEALAMSGKFAPSAKTTMEVIYNSFHPLALALILYFGAFLCFMAQSLHGASIWRGLSIASTIGGLLSHGAAIALRVLILERPPVGTLYELIIFVAFVCVLCGLIYESIKQDRTGVLAAMVCGILLLFVAQSFAGEDTMKMLVAVLNTNFWLATHVLCITMGYGWCLFASFLAHIWLYHKGSHIKMSSTPVKTVALIALLFTATGTILGGIWADQSWGRFWGWDPKENGALLITLWLIWALHGRLAGQLNEKLFMIAIAALSVVVGMAWFGVNLLNVGLHSYGFITGVAMGLGAFCAAEFALIGFLYFRIQKASVIL